MAEGFSDREMGPQDEYEKAVDALQGANLLSLCQFFKEQGLKDEVLLSLESEEDMKELLVQKLQPFTQLWFQRHLTFATPRGFGASAANIFYEAGSKFIGVKIEDRETEFKSMIAPPPHAGPQNSLLTWKMMEKAKSFICGCLNADRKGIIYFGVGDQDRKIHGLEIENMLNEISTAFTSVLQDHIRSDTSGSLSVEEQDCIKLLFIPVRNQGHPTGLYVMEIEVERKWMFCEDHVYYGKKWNEKSDNHITAGSTSLHAFYNVKQGEWDDVQVRLFSDTTKVKKEEVHEKVKKPLQIKYKGWKKNANQDSNSPLTDELIQKARKKVVTESMIAFIIEDVAAFWKRLAPYLGIKAAICNIIDEEEKKVIRKGTRLLQYWIQKKGGEATVGRLVDVLEEINKKAIWEKLLLEVAKVTE